MAPFKIWTAIPDSILSDCSDIRDKTEKIGIIARACAIYKISRIYIYHDRGERLRYDQKLISVLLQYAETPPYLRKHLFKKMPELAAAGILPPLRTPNHQLDSDITSLKSGTIREGYWFKIAGTKFVDIGFKSPGLLQGEVPDKRRITVRVIATNPQIVCVPVDQKEIDTYWGYTVKQIEDIGKLIRSSKPIFVIATSINGEEIHKIWDTLGKKIQSYQRCLVLFGSPKRGLTEILKDENEKLSTLSDITVNMVPSQGTKTVRSEEAMHATFSILNLLRSTNS